MTVVSLYARVSSKRQAQEDTIGSQLANLESRIDKDGYELLNEYKFIDNGYSGSNLKRPGLNSLRGKVAEGKISKIYIHSPDRLSREYEHLMILREEFREAGTEVIFLNFQVNDSSESELSFRMQGITAEYSYEKMKDRNRRGKIRAAREGRVSVMSNAPYGYRYVRHIVREK
ncbi:MAG: recombinase family protein, partial [Wolbachia endosymbiont of Alcedoecus sp.]|nr:recombinase family protein [Wolbachia endosymbiont of Alcedoecus sp.]